MDAPYDDLDERSELAKEVRAFVVAHDALVALIHRQAETTGPLWVTRSRKNNATFHIDPSEDEFSTD